MPDYKTLDELRADLDVETTKHVPVGNPMAVSSGVKIGIFKVVIQNNTPKEPTDG